MSHYLACILFLSSAALGCGSDSTDDTSELPPTSGRVDIEAWLADGAYQSWECEAEAHPARSPSPHGINRICSNAALSGHGDGEFPVGAAAVKELYDDAGDTIIGYAVSRHVEAGTTGASWYWYERVPLDHPAPHDDNGVVADGNGDSGPELAICAACHMGAGSDAEHSGHDFVYTQVR